MSGIYFGQFLSEIKRADYRKAFEIFFENNTLYKDIFRRKDYVWKHGEYPIIDKIFDLVFFAKSKHETIAFVLGAYHAGFHYEVPNICYGNTYGVDYFFEKVGYHKTSGEGKKWIIANSMRGELDNVDWRIIGRDMNIKYLNF